MFNFISIFFLVNVCLSLTFSIFILLRFIFARVLSLSVAFLACHPFDGFLAYWDEPKRHLLLTLSLPRRRGRGGGNKHLRRTVEQIGHLNLGGICCVPLRWDFVDGFVRLLHVARVWWCGQRFGPHPHGLPEGGGLVFLFQCLLGFFNCLFSVVSYLTLVVNLVFK